MVHVVCIYVYLHREVLGEISTVSNHYLQVVTVAMILIFLYTYFYFLIFV